MGGNGKYLRPGRWHPERFWTSFTVNSVNGCWEWNKMPRKQKRPGWHWYGHFRIAQVTWMAHRYSWTINRGPIPEGLWVLHRCDNGRCVNPDHLFLGTPSDNAVDRDDKKRGRESRKTHCKHGHEFTAENTYLWNDPARRGREQRKCRECNRLNLRKYVSEGKR